MTWEAEDIRLLRERLAKIDSWSEEYRVAEAGEQFDRCHELDLMIESEHDWTRPALADFARDVLDAFEAMERDRWQIIYWGDYSDRTGKPLFSVENETLDGPCIAQAKSPLAALLAAAATLEGKTDAV